MKFLVHLSAGSDPTFPIERRLLSSTTNFHSQPCSTLEFRRVLSCDPFCSFCTQNLLLHSFDNTPFLTRVSQTAPSCTIPAVQIKQTKHAGLHLRCKQMEDIKLKLNDDKTECLFIVSIQTTSLHFSHQNLPHTFHENKNLWTMSFFFHGPDTMELITI